MWLANNHRDPLYWSHAGQFFDLKDFGMFWVYNQIREKTKFEIRPTPKSEKPEIRKFQI